MEAQEGPDVTSIYLTCASWNVNFKHLTWIL